MALGRPHVGHPVASKVVIGKSTCKSTKWMTCGTDNLHSNGAPQKDQKMIHQYYGSGKGPEAQAPSLADVKRNKYRPRDPS
uniref:Uncharacterized protein n=1 Tax=Romanomermis culicivorax TaxID=13658 RepID=A0A915K2X8_ROMCU